MRTNERDKLLNLGLNYFVACTGIEAEQALIFMGDSLATAPAPREFETTADWSPANASSGVPYQVWRAIYETGGPGNPAWEARVNNGFTSMYNLHGGHAGLHSFLSSAEDSLSYLHKHPWAEYLANAVHVRAPGVLAAVQTCPFPPGALNALLQTASSLDVFMHCNYPFPTGTPTSGLGFQNALQTSASQFGEAATAIRTHQPGTPFYAIIQAHQASGRYNYRSPSLEEILCQINLALAYGADGIIYYLYTRTADGQEGLLDANRNPTSRYTSVQSIHNNYQGMSQSLVNIGANFLPLSWQAGFSIHQNTTEPISSTYKLYDVQSKVPGGGWDAGNETYVETGVLQSGATNHYMVVNRRCTSTESREITMRFQSTSANAYLITDLFTGDQKRFLPANATTITYTFTLGPGQGKLLKLEDLGNWSGTISSNTTWPGTVCVNANATVTSAATLTLASGANVIIAAGATLTVQGALVLPSNATVSGGGTIVTSGSGKIYVTNSSEATAFNNSRKLVRDAAGNYHLVFETDGEICYEKLTGTGALSEFRRLSSGDGSNKYPCLAEHSGKLYVVWQRKTGTNTYDLKYRRFSGSAWDGIQTINGATAITSANALLPAIALSKPATDFEMMVIYRSSAGLRAKRSTNAAESNWPGLSEIAVTNNTNARNPSLIYRRDDDVPTHRFHVTWDQGSDIYHQSYNGTLNSWTAAADISTDPFASSNQYSSYAISANNDRHVVWQALEAEVYFRQVIYHNRNLGNAVAMLVSNNYDQLRPSITGHTGGAATAVCQDNSGGQNIRKRRYNGTSWEGSAAGTIIASNGADVSLAIANPPGAASLALWRSAGSAPHALIVGPAGGLSKSSSEEDLVYHRRIAYFWDDSTNLMLQIDAFQIVAGESQNSLAFPEISVDSLLSSDLAATVSLSGVVLPANTDSLAFTLHLSSRNAGQLRRDDHLTAGVAFEISSAETGLPVANIALPSLAATGTTKQSVRLVFPLQAWRGQKITLAPKFSNLDLAKAGGALVHVYEAVEDAAQKARAAAAALLAPLPASFSVNVHPNPFNPATRIQFHLPTAGLVTVQVYDVYGRMVRELSRDWRQAGTHQITWDGRNQHGRAVASGTYFTHVASGEERKVVKMTLMR
ncbi:T9SS type A sorting domain-containing protein [bacterium]|nr:T9SS type A sorting domain-containing protein [bacterium]